MMKQSQKIVKVPETACLRLRISYKEEFDLLYIEHFDATDKLISECRLTVEDAYDYAKSINQVCDEAIGVD